MSIRFEDLTSEQVQQIAEFEAACEAQARPIIEVGMMVSQNGMVEGRVVRIINDAEVMLSRPTKNSKRWSTWSWIAPASSLTIIK